MVRVTGPFLSLDARGTIANALTGSFSRGVNYIKRKVVPKMMVREARRKLFTLGASAWNNLSDNEKEYYNDLKYPSGMTGYNRFMREWLKTNPFSYYGERIYGIFAYGNV